MAHTVTPRRVTILGKNADGTAAIKTIVAPSEKKKGTKGLSLIEKIVRTGAEVGTTAGNSYLARHEKSNAKKKDGWVKDAPINVIKAGMKGIKKVKISKFL